MAFMAASPEGFSIFKEGVGLHGFMAPNTPDFLYGELRDVPLHPNRGFLTPSGISHIIDCVAAMKEVIGPNRRLALDMGTGVHRARRDPRADGARAVRHRVGRGSADR